MTWPIFDDENHHSAIEVIETSRSDPTVAIVGGAMLEHAVEETLKLRLRNHSDTIKKLFKTTGAIGSLGAQVDLLFVLNLIERAEHKALCGLIEIRNYFAHNLGASFESSDTKFLTPLKKLTLHERRTHYPHTFLKVTSTTKIERIRNNRDQFKVNLKLGLGILMHIRIDHIPYTLEKQSESSRAKAEAEWIERKAKLGRKQDWVADDISDVSS